MRRVLVAAAVCALVARPASAQYTQAKRAAQNAAAATNRHIAAEQRTDGAEQQQQPRAQRVASAGAEAKSAAATVEKPIEPASKTTTSAARPGTRRPQDALNINAPADTVSAPVEIMREVYRYSRDGRRDPFVSLLTTSELRPTMSDLRLTTIIYDANGRHSLAVLRDAATGEQHRVAVGATLGRMQVAAIRPKVIVFTIDEFGTNRQDSLVLIDPTKVRP
jgi:Flp pilus assembly protein TadG